MNLFFSYIIPFKSPCLNLFPRGPSGPACPGAPLGPLAPASPFIPASPFQIQKLTVKVLFKCTYKIC